MDLRRLEAFKKVYALKSFSKAGQDLFLSQPTISSHIATLEEELGVNLFDRVGRGILPTQAAHVLYRHTLEIFSAVQRARESIQELTQTVSGELLIGGSTIPADYLLPDLLAGFSRRYPEVRVNLSVGDSAEIQEKVLSGELVVGVIGARDTIRDLSFVPILEDQLVVVAPKAHRLEGKSIKDPLVLSSLPWIIREKGSGTRKAMEQGLHQLGIDMRDLIVVIQVQSTGAVLRCVEAGLGVSVTSRLAASAFVERGDMVVLDVPAFCMNRSFFAVFHEKREFFPASRKFIEFLTDFSNPPIAGTKTRRMQCPM